MGRNHFRGRKSNFSVSALKKSLRSGVINELLFINSETRNIGSNFLVIYQCQSNQNDLVLTIQGRLRSVFDELATGYVEDPFL